VKLGVAKIITDDLCGYATLWGNRLIRGAESQRERNIDQPTGLDFIRRIMKRRPARASGAGGSRRGVPTGAKGNDCRAYAHQVRGIGPAAPRRSGRNATNS